MASSNRHWPSLFKSKPCNTHHQWQHDINPSSLLSGGCQKTPCTSAIPGCEERSPEPKPRWNPKPEQIRILEAIFNSGMVNPPRDEIRKIRVQLQEYGQVGDANVFYWFQNRKSRSKHKQRHLQSSRLHPRSATTATAAPSPPTTAAPAPTATSSSSDRSSGSDKIVPSVTSIGGSSGVTDMPVSTPVVVNQPCFHVPVELGGDPFFVQVPQTYCFGPQELAGILGAPEQGAGLCSALWSELMGQVGCKLDEDEAKTKAQLHHSFSVGAATGATVTCVGAPVAVTGAATIVGAADSASPASPFSEVQGLGGAGGGGATRVTVFINEVAFEVAAGPFNVREAFGEAALLLHSSGHLVLTDEQGVTLQPLQHGASYYVV
ncbi:WUSCHEL-related homeobox 9-like isoform X2 [Phoenix dactylifera]|uniref:WUSCHEL-related homeobox 9-like isoform X2 n=1 Tax=Phoenix dactylifera TaxID=42345 RepID=A0A8B9ARD5_PHODC|nr:WUSCHEL-related homeobox 9-like isoform X2 [Phoenix dactylifera]